MEKMIILGSGVSGLACYYYLKENYDITILEKENYFGGLCQSFEVNDFWFDYGAHATFAQDKTVRKLLETGVDTVDNVADALNYKNGVWIKQPVQNNLYRLDIDEKVKILNDFVQRNDDEKYLNYEDWLEKKYGRYFAFNFPRLYTEKYWTVHPSLLETKWIGPRMYTPTMEEVLYGAFSENTPNVHYSGSIRYPYTGGFARFLKNVSQGANIYCDASIEKINTLNRSVQYNGKVLKYDKLISTIPLPEIITLLDDVPDEVKKASNKLNYTTLVIVSFGINKEKIMPEDSKLFYVYDEKKYISRAYSTTEFGKGNAPMGCSTIQAEVYFSKFKPLKYSLDEIKIKVKNEFFEMNLFDEDDILVEDVRMVQYANIIFTKDIYENRNIVHDFLKVRGIEYAGRFGEWDYLWSDQSILSGKKVAEKFLVQK